jgi:hypothetical protein
MDSRWISENSARDSVVQAQAPSSLSPSPYIFRFTSGHAHLASPCAAFHLPLFYPRVHKVPPQLPHSCKFSQDFHLSLSFFVCVFSRLVCWGPLLMLDDSSSCSSFALSSLARKLAVLLVLADKKGGRKRTRRSREGYGGQR